MSSWSGSRSVSIIWGESGQIISVSPSSFTGGTPTTVTVRVYNSGDSDDMLIECASYPSGWSVSPSSRNPYMNHGTYYDALFTVTPPAAGGTGTIVWEFRDDDVLSNDLLDTVIQSVSATDTVPESITAPNTPSGPSDGDVNQSLSFSTGGSTSNKGHSIEYRFDWGDGIYSSWSTTTTRTHSYSTVGNYNVRAQARCATHTSVVSSWSGSRSVSIIWGESGQIISVSPSSFTGGTPTTVTVRVYNSGDSDDMLIECASYPSGWRCFSQFQKSVYESWYLLRCLVYGDTSGSRRDRYDRMGIQG